MAMRRFGGNITLEDFRSLLQKEEFEEEPVDLHRFVTDPYFLGLKPLSPVQEQIASKMTQIFLPHTLEKMHGKEKAQQIWESTVNEVICQIGKGGGKDWCFAYETEIITKDGIRKIGDVANTVQTLLTSQGWKEAKVLETSVLPIWKLVVKRGDETKEIHTTRYHRWFATKTLDMVKRKFEETYTCDLVHGSWLQVNYEHRDINPGPEAHWKVVSVEETDRVEQTYCPDVPEIHNFTLEGNILTGNTLRIAFARIIYLMHCLRDPLDYYGIGHGEYIDLLNIALNSEQAQRVFFDPLKNLLIASPYFQKKGFIPMSKKIEFMERPIRCFSGHSEAEGWEGYNLIAVTLDEISAFKTQDDSAHTQESVKFSAKAIYDMARLSVISRFPQVGKVALLSFPRYENDFIQQRYDGVIERKITRKVTKDLGPITIWWEDDEILGYREPRVWAIKCPTFVSNPTKKPEDFTSDFIRDPVNANARILCRPPKMAEAYFRDPDRVMACFHKHDESCTDKYCVRSPFDEEGRLPPTFRDKDDSAAPRFIHIDLGLNRDRSALCMVHCEGFRKSETDGQIMPVIRMDLIKYWEAPPNGEIDFNDVRRFVFMLNDRFNVAMVTMDRWQSVDTKNIFMNKGIYTEFMVVKKDHYDTLSTSIYDGRLRAYYHPILVDQELLKLQLIRGNKVDHPRKGFKDGADSLAGAVYTCTVNTPVEEVIDIDILGTPQPVKQDEEERREEHVQEKEMPDDIEEYLSGMGLI